MLYCYQSQLPGRTSWEENCDRALWNGESKRPQGRNYGAREPVKRSWHRFAAAFDRESQETRRMASPEQLEAFFNRDSEVPAVDYSSVTTR